MHYPHEGKTGTWEEKMGLRTMIFIYSRTTNVGKKLVSPRM